MSNWQGGGPPGGAPPGVMTREPLRLGPLLARCVFEPGSANRAPGVSYDP
jgi:hypothetical protein